MPGTTVDRQCGSQQAIHFAAQGVISGSCDIVVAAGVESMSRAPMGSSGARIMTTLGLQTMCEGGGMANATIIERLESFRRPASATPGAVRTAG